MSRKTKTIQLNLRVSEAEKAEYESFAKSVYDLDNTSEFIRLSLQYIMEKRPVLGKSFAPESMTSQVATTSL